MRGSIIGVGMPVYNGSAYLAEALASVLGQQNVELEVYVADDASTDGTAGVVRRFDDPRLHYHLNDRRLGLAGNWNRVMGLSNSKYLCIFHQDDLMDPANLARKVAFLECHPQAAMVYSLARYIDCNGCDLGPTDERPAAVGSPMLQESNTFIESVLFDPVNPVCCPGVVMRRTALEQVGPFRTDLGFTPDVEMWLRLGTRGFVGYIPHPLVSYRRHAAQETENFREYKGLREEWIAKSGFLNRLDARQWPVAQWRKRLRKVYAVRAINAAYSSARKRNRRNAVRLFALAVRADPVSFFKPKRLGVVVGLIKRIGFGEKKAVRPYDG